MPCLCPWGTSCDKLPYFLHEPAARAMHIFMRAKIVRLELIMSSVMPTSKIQARSGTYMPGQGSHVFMWAKIVRLKLIVSSVAPTSKMQARSGTYMPCFHIWRTSCTHQLAALALHVFLHAMIAILKLSASSITLALSIWVRSRADISCSRTWSTSCYELPYFMYELATHTVHAFMHAIIIVLKLIGSSAALALNRRARSDTYMSRLHFWRTG
mmetsp:Transcript_155662/g.298717  ORF Transcript_155662/g.298717 Transcript_155662/m.298717 type:complete len:213 (-) Transcript_155662:47-685(-)